MIQKLQSEIYLLNIKMRNDPDFILLNLDDKFIYDVRVQRSVTELRCKKKELEIIDDIAALNAERVYVAIRGALELGQDGLENQKREFTAGMQANFHRHDLKTIYRVAEEISRRLKQEKPFHLARNIIALIENDLHHVIILFD